MNTLLLIIIIAIILLFLMYTIVKIVENISFICCCFYINKSIKKSIPLDLLDKIVNPENAKDFLEFIICMDNLHTGCNDLSCMDGNIYGPMSSQSLFESRTPIRTGTSLSDDCFLLLSKIKASEGKMGEDDEKEMKKIKKTIVRNNKKNIRWSIFETLIYFAVVGAIAFAVITQYL